MPASDPLKVTGQPPPTEAERRQIMAFAESTGRPAKFCRYALIEAKGDEGEARRLIDDEEFLRLHTDFDFDVMSALGNNPAAIMQYVTRQEMTHAGRSEAEISRTTMERVGEVAEYTKQVAASMKRERKRLKKVAGQTVDDPLFGRLTHDGYSWTGTLELPPFGRGLELIVELPDFADQVVYPSQRQRQVVDRFRSTAATRYRQTERALFETFRKVRTQLVNEQEHMVRLMPNWVSEPIPDPAIASDIWPQVDGAPTIVVGPDTDNGPVAITLAYSVAWDPEHGNHIRFESGRVVQAGSP